MIYTVDMVYGIDIWTWGLRALRVTRVARGTEEADGAELVRWLRVLT